MNDVRALKIRVLFAWLKQSGSVNK